MLKLVKKFWNDEQGLEMSEYAVMVALICMVIVAAIGVLSGAIGKAFEDTATVIDTRPTP